MKLINGGLVVFIIGAGSASDGAFFSEPRSDGITQMIYSNPLACY